MSLLRRLWSSVRRTRIDDDLRAELDAHLALLEEEERADGTDAEEARRRARARFGSPLVYRERALDAVMATSIEHAWRDLRYAFRTLRRAPGFTTAAILTLAIGMGGATTVYSYLRVLLTATAPLTPLDPIAYSSTIGLLLALAAIAALVPAVRAARIDPLLALKQE